MNKFSSYIISGGTNFHIRPHLALCAPAYGQTGRDIHSHLLEYFKEKYDEPMQWTHHLYLTKMAGGTYQKEDGSPLYFDTNADVEALVDKIIADPDAKVLFMPVALCDFNVDEIIVDDIESDGAVGKHLPRLDSGVPVLLSCVQANKIIGKIRKTRKDIFLVGFKTTTGATEQEQFEAGLKLLKKSSCNLVLANDLQTRVNMVITPEQAKYYVGTDRKVTIEGLVKMTASRCNGEFTRSTVVPGDLVPWNSPEVPESLRTVVNHCIKRGAYRPFLGATVGHFAVKVAPGQFLTSVRKTNFNELDKAGLVKIEVRGQDEVVAYGARPSVGGQSQRIVFTEHPDVDCIVHFHCQMKGDWNENLARGPIPIRSQLEHECGSHACGQNTSSGLKTFEIYNGILKYPVKAVMLDKHGPNIVFNRNADPQAVIKFIEDHFDLTKQTSELS